MTGLGARGADIVIGESTDSILWGGATGCGTIEAVADAIAGAVWTEVACDGGGGCDAGPVVGACVLDCWERGGAVAVSGDGIMAGAEAAVGGCGGWVDVASGVGGFARGVGGGGIAPPGGPYCSMGRKTGCCDAGLLGSLTAYMVASKKCGSREIVTWPTLAMLSLGGFLGSSWTTPFFLVGLDQYFSNRPSLIHRWRDRASDSARTPLQHDQSQ